MDKELCYYCGQYNFNSTTGTPCIRCGTGGEGEEEKKMNTFMDRLRALERKIKILTEKRADVLAEWVENEHPLEVGDEVVVNTTMFEGEKMVVDDRTIDCKFGVWKWVAVGRLAVKGGVKGSWRGKWIEKMKE